MNKASVEDGSIQVAKIRSLALKIPVSNRLSDSHL
jgi:hypothetical protein